MIYIIMGVSGCGKSSLGMLLSEKLGWTFYEGDAFHPKENIEKMARGEPLTDQDRFPWLLTLHDIIQRERCSGSDALVACSALKRHYRQILLHGCRALAPPAPAPPASSPPHQDVSSPLPGVFFLYLHGDYDYIYQRLVARKGHYMRAELLCSQFQALEPPLHEENVLTLDIRKGSHVMAAEVEKHIISMKSAITAS